MIKLKDSTMSVMLGNDSVSPLSPQWGWSVLFADVLCLFTASTGVLAESAKRTAYGAPIAAAADVDVRTDDAMKALLGTGAVGPGVLLTTALVAVGRGDDDAASSGHRFSACSTFSSHLTSGQKWACPRPVIIPAVDAIRLPFPELCFLIFLKSTGGRGKCWPA